MKWAYQASKGERGRGRAMRGGTDEKGEEAKKSFLFVFTDLRRGTRISSRRRKERERKKRRTLTVLMLLVLLLLLLHRPEALHRRREEPTGRRGRCERAERRVEAVPSSLTGRADPQRAERVGRGDRGVSGGEGWREGHPEGSSSSSSSHPAAATESRSVRVRDERRDAG